MPLVSVILFSVRSIFQVKASIEKQGAIARIQNEVLIVAKNENSNVSGRTMHCMF